MLSEAEEAGVRDLLSMVAEDDLFSIAKTATNRMIVPEYAKEAVDLIIKCTDRPSTFLRRKRLKKDIIFSYLIKRGVSAKASDDKEKMSKALLKYWNSKDWEMPIDFEDTSSSNSQEVQFPANKSSSVQIPTSSSPEAQEMAIEFCRWFYDNWNRYGEPGVDFRPDHLWSDCSLKVCLRSPDGIQVDEVHSDNVQTFSTLLGLRDTHGLWFNPNCCADGIKGRMEPHGMVSVLACGTLHSRQTRVCCGMFEQFFGLVRDPLGGDNNWKVKVTHVQLTQTQVQAMPRIMDTDLGKQLAVCDVII